MFLSRLKSLSKVVEDTVYTSPDRKLTEAQALQLSHAFLLQTKENGGTVYTVGNGGSAAIASHFCVDLLNALSIPAQTLFDLSVMTCISNDYGYDQVFSRPLKTLLKRNDLVVCISSSGASANIVNAALTAKECDLPLITLSGFDENNPLRELGDLNFYIQSRDYGLVETGHFFLLHTIIDSWNFGSSLTNEEEPVSHLIHAK